MLQCRELGQHFLDEPTYTGLACRVRESTFGFGRGKFLLELDGVFFIGWIGILNFACQLGLLGRQRFQLLIDLGDLTTNRTGLLFKIVFVNRFTVCSIDCICQICHGEVALGWIRRAVTT